MSYKIQALNGFKLYFDQLSLVFNEKNSGEGKVDYDRLTELTGLNRRKIRMLFTFLSDIGFTTKRSLKSTELGKIVFRNDPYLEDEGTLWIMHYLAAANSYLLIWNRIFNSIALLGEFTKIDLLKNFSDLKDTISEDSFKDHIGKEITVVLDAYVNQRFAKLGLLEFEDGIYQTVRNQNIPELILLTFMVHYRDQYYPGASAIEIGDLVDGENAPGRILFWDEGYLRNRLEDLKGHALIGIESRADLDQVRFGSDLRFENIVEQYYKSIRG
ncbi:MAG: DUF4007 family protein [Clostridia bacterium]|nr:DUF4007 family protein [Clostridia bacterium]